MVSKITIFEPHFDNAQFGPASSGSKRAEHHAEQDSDEGGNGTEQAGSDRGRSFVRPVIAVVVAVALLAAGYLLVRRKRAEPVEFVDIEETTGKRDTDSGSSGDSDSDDVTIESR